MVQRQMMGLMAALLFTGAIPVSSIAQETTGEQKKAEIHQLCSNLQPQFTLTGHLSPVNAIAVSADSKTLVSGDENGVVNVWSLETGQLIRSLAAYPGTVRAIAITPDGKSTVSLVNGDEKNSVVSIWSLETGQLIRNFEAGSGEGKALAISPDSKGIVSVMQAKRTGETDEKDKLDVKVWSLQTGELIQSSTQEQGVAQTLDSLNILSLIRVSEVGEGYSPVVNIEFLNRNTGNIIQPASPTANQERYTERDPSSAQDSSKKIAATVSVLGLDKDISFVTLQDSTTQKSLCTVPKSGQVRNIIFSPDSQKLIVAGQRIEVMALNSIPVKLVRSEQQAKIQHLNRLGLDKLKRKQYYSAAQHFWQVFELNRLLADEQGQIDALYNIAEAKYDLCQVGFNSCRTDYQGLYELLLPYFQSRGDRLREATALYKLGKGSSKEEAWTFFQKALETYEQLGNTEGQLNTLIELGAVSAAYGEQFRPNQLFGKAIRINEIKNAKVGRYQTLLKIGQSLYQRRESGETEQARSFFNQALANVRAARDRKAEAQILSQLEVSYNSDESINFYRQALKIYHSLGDQKAEADTLVKMAWKNKYGIDNVQSLLKQALKLYRKIGESQGELEVLHSLGLSVSTTLEDKDRRFTGQRIPEAITYLRAAVKLSNETGNRFLESTILLDLGDIYRSGKQYSQALAAYQQALNIRQILSDDTGKAIFLYKIAQVKHQLKQYAQAVERLQETLTICQAVEDCLYLGREYSTWKGTSSILRELGETYFDAKQYPQALTYFQQLASTSSPAYDWTLAKEMGLTYENLGNYNLALKYFDFILNARGPGCGDGATSDATIVDAIRDETYQRNFGCGSSVDTEGWDLALSTATLHSAEIYRRRGQYAQAATVYEKTVSRFGGYRSDTEAILLNNLGTLYKSQGSYNKALQAYQKSLRIRQAKKDIYGEAVSLNNIGEVYRRQGQYSKALETYQQSLKIFRELTHSLTISQAKITPILDISTVRQGEASSASRFCDEYKCLSLND